MENKIKQKYGDIWQLLGCYFHEDIESVENGIQDILEETNHEYKQSIVKLISKFESDESFSIEDKNDFIKHNVRWFLPKSPLDWLQDLAIKIEKKIQEK